MRITCPTCSAQYDVDEDDIEVEGQDVQCSDCLTIWMQTRDGEATNPRTADALAEGEQIAEDAEIDEAVAEVTTEVHDEIPEGVAPEIVENIIDAVDESPEEGTSEEVFSGNVEHVEFGNGADDDQDSVTDDRTLDENEPALEEVLDAEEGAADTFDTAQDESDDEHAEDEATLEPETEIAEITADDGELPELRDYATPDFVEELEKPSEEELEVEPELAAAPTWSGIAALADDITIENDLGTVEEPDAIDETLGDVTENSDETLEDDDAQNTDTIDEIAHETSDLDIEWNEAADDVLDEGLHDEENAQSNEISIETTAIHDEALANADEDDDEFEDESSWGGISSIVAAGAAAVGLSANKSDDEDTPEESAQITSDEQEAAEEDLPDIEEAAEEDADSVWAEIAEMAKGADDTSDVFEEDPSDELPDLTPPIQSEPAAAVDVPLEEDVDQGDEHPWETAAEEDEEFTDFVWSDPSKSVEEPAEEDDFDLSTLSETIAELNEPDDPKAEEDDIGDDELSMLLNEQIAIEDDLDGAPAPRGVAVDGVVPEELLVGKRARVPDVSALKTTLMAKSIPLTEDEKSVLKPVRRFRRGFILAILVFLILLSIYVSRMQIGNLVPALAPVLDSYGSIVDFLRLRAENLDNTIVMLFGQGFDWVMAKISGA